MIPKRLHYVWVGSHLPDKQRAFIDSWRETNPDYELDFGHSSSVAGHVYQGVECEVGGFGYIVYLTRRFKTASGP